MDNSHSNLATDKAAKLTQLKVLAYKSSLAKANQTLHKDSAKPLLGGLVKLKRKSDSPMIKNSELQQALNSKTSTSSFQASDCGSIIDNVNESEDDTNHKSEETVVSASSHIPVSASSHTPVSATAAVKQLCDYSDSSNSSFTE